MTDYQTQRVLSDIQSHIASVDDRLAAHTCATNAADRLAVEKPCRAVSQHHEPKGTNAFAHSSTTPIGRNSK